MRLLIDTHVFLWSIASVDKLSETAKHVLLDRDSEIYLSAASYWEICIKQSIGRLNLASNWMQLFDEEIKVNRIKWLPIEKVHLQGVATLPYVHRDPFDRLLIAQAQKENLIFLSKDRHVQKYDIETLW